MKRSFIILVISVITFLMAISSVKAVEYPTTNFKDTLAAEGITLKNEKYQETEDQITIYLFRSQGCVNCRNFLNFLNDISEEYGKYFKLVSYETYQNVNNSALMKEVSEFLGKNANGVPFIVIGKKSFVGYGASLSESIKKAIVDLYNSENRYDVFYAMEHDDSNDIVIVSVIFGVIALAVGGLIIGSRRSSKTKEA